MFLLTKAGRTFARDDQAYIKHTQIKVELRSLRRGWYCLFSYVDWRNHLLLHLDTELKSLDLLRTVVWNPSSREAEKSLTWAELATILSGLIGEPATKGPHTEWTHDLEFHAAPHR